VALYAQPCDVTLVKDFLRPWVTSGDIKAGGAGAYVQASDLYSADPGSWRGDSIRPSPWTATTRGTS
jgi:hypothetical protein